MKFLFFIFTLFFIIACSKSESNSADAFLGHWVSKKDNAQTPTIRNVYLYTDENIPYDSITTSRKIILNDSLYTIFFGAPYRYLKAYAKDDKIVYYDSIHFVSSYSAVCSETEFVYYDIYAFIKNDTLYENGKFLERIYEGTTFVNGYYKGKFIKKN